MSDDRRTPDNGLAQPIKQREAQPPVLQHKAALFQCTPACLDKARRGERLFQKIIGPAANGPNRHIDIAMPVMRITGRPESIS